MKTEIKITNDFIVIDLIPTNSFEETMMEDINLIKKDFTISTSVLEEIKPLSLEHSNKIRLTFSEKPKQK